MQLYLKIEANEIELCPDHTRYNNLCWKLKKPFLGITHFIEKFDDICEVPDCVLGVIKDGRFHSYGYGEFEEAIQKPTIGFGGVWYDVYIPYPKGIFRLNV